MPPDLLNLSFDKLGVFLLSLIPALINIAIFFYISFFLPQNKTNRTFSIFVILLGVSQVTDGLMRMSVTEETAYLYNRISVAPWVFTLPFGLLFALRFTSWHIKIHYAFLQILLFFPALVLEILMIARLDQYTIVKSENWNWIANPESTTVTNIIYLWISVIGFITLIIFWAYYIKEKSNIRKKTQALLLASGYIIPFIAGIGAELFLPLVLNMDGIPLGTPSITAFSIASIIAIKKYHMFDYSPKHQWGKIVEGMHEGILIVDNSDKIMYANDAFCKSTKYEFNEIKGKIANELFFDIEDKKKQIEKIIEERKEKKSSQYQVPIKTKTGETIWMIISGSPYLDRKGKVIGSIGIQTNITPIKELEKKLDNNISLLKEAQAIAHVGSWELDFATNIAIWSEEAGRIYGLAPDDNIQSFETWIKFVHPEDLPYVYEKIEKQKSTLADSSFQHRIVLKNGTIKHIHSRSRFKLNETGIPIGIYGTCQDITQQHKTELALKNNVSKVKKFASYLNNTMESERSYIAKEIHDELGQYLTGLKFGLSSFQKFFNGNEKINARIEGMMTDIENTQQSVRKIATKLRPGILDTLGLIPSIKWLVADFQKRTGIECNFALKGAEKKYKSDISTCFFRICQESLTNISKHAEATKVNIEINQTDSILTLTISDNGKGILEEVLQNPFSMGLIGMKERADSLGLNFELSSKKNLGTTIKLELKYD